MGSLLPAKRHPLATALLVLVSLTATTIAQEFVAKARQQTAASAPDSAARLQALLAEARVLLRYDLTEATTTARQAAQLAATIGDQAARAHALATEAVAAATYIGPDEAQNKARAAIRLLPADAPLATQAYVWLAKTTVHYTIDDMEECLIALRRAVDLADEADETDLIVKSRILTIGAVGWRDDPITGAQDMLAFAQTGASPPVLLEAKVLATVTRRGGGVVADYERDLRTLLASAVRLGDRAAAGFVQSCLARLYAPEDPDRAYRLASEALATFRQWGNREHIALAQHYLAKLAMHREPPDEALERIDLAIAELDGMGMLDSTITVLETAIHIASVQGLADKARAYGEQHDMLQKQITKRHTRGYRSRFWREVNDLSKRLRATQRHHQEEVEDLDARLTNLALVSGGTIILLLVIASLLQLQSQRRVARANKELQEALQTSQALQEERAALQQNLQQIERLDSIGLLAGGFAHDFNNILVGVRGNAQLLQMDENLSAEQQQMLSQIVLASDRAAGLCRDILAYAHASPTPMMVIDLRDVLTGLIPLAQAGFGSGIEITLDTGNHPMPVEADRAQIEQVFLNLIVNAGDAIGDRGTIRISIDECHLGGRPPSGNWFGEFTGEPRDCIAVSVLDNGHGMPPETIRRVFDPFFSTRFAGRGLGLAAAFGILRRHQGIVEIQSEVGRGTQFTIYLPKRAEPAANNTADEPTVELPRPQLEPPASEAAHPARTILVVDDEESVRNVVRHALTATGYNVLLAGAGVEAIQLFEQHGDRIPVALLDMTMPDMDGAELAHCLLRRDPDLKVVFMTGDAQRADPSLDRPMISKPFALEELLAVLRRQEAPTN